MADQAQYAGYWINHQDTFCPGRGFILAINNLDSVSLPDGEDQDEEIIYPFS